MARTTKKPGRGSQTFVEPSPLPASALRWQCDPDWLDFETTDEVEPVRGVIGQDSAVESLRFGLATDAQGQNIFVRGLTGTGRSTLVRRLLEEIRPFCSETQDRCYVHSFSQPDRPRLITLPSGQGPTFARRVDRLVNFIRRNLRTALSSEGVNARRTALKQATEAKLKEIVEPFQEALEKAGLAVVNIEAGTAMHAVLFPIVEGKPVPPEEFDTLHRQKKISDDVYNAAKEAYGEFEPQLAEVNERANEIHRQHDDAEAGVLEHAARSTLRGFVREVEKEFPQEAVSGFLGELVDDVVKYHLGNEPEEEDFTDLYRVNVVLEHREDGRCPIVAENTASVRSLLGTVDFDFSPGGDAHPTHMGIRAGALLRADGGYLILEDQDILNEQGAWKALVRVLRTGQLEITPPDHPLAGWAPTLRPEPIDVKLKVILLGDPYTYSVLDMSDPTFPHLFKVLADFDYEIPRDEQGVSHYASVLSRIVKEEELPPFDRAAVARLAEFGARVAAREGKLTARFGRLADIAREAAFVAEQAGRRPVTAHDVRDAIERGKSRADLPARKFREYIADGTILVQTTGVAVGQINALAVLQAGPMTYGFPTRITASIGPGTAGVINIEREAALSGAIHTKGFYILGGLLRNLLNTDHPLAFDASIAFEQSYGSIDGDSASGAEICCLLSALTGIPLRQDIAMTGAIDQMGHILAIGAANEKIEGFFDACRDLGTTGTQGVMIPKANAGDLMLREDLIEACTDGSFRIYAVETVHEALEVLTRMPAGRRDARHRYPKGTVLGTAVAKAYDCWIKASQAPRTRRITVREPAPKDSKKRPPRRPKSTRKKKSSKR